MVFLDHHSSVQETCSCCTMVMETNTETLFLKRVLLGRRFALAQHFIHHIRSQEKSSPHPSASMLIAIVCAAWTRVKGTYQPLTTGDKQCCNSSHSRTVLRSFWPSSMRFNLPVSILRFCLFVCNMWPNKQNLRYWNTCWCPYSDDNCTFQSWIPPVPSQPVSERLGKAINARYCNISLKHRDRTTMLGMYVCDIILSEMWAPTQLPHLFLKVVEKQCKMGYLFTILNQGL